MAVSETTRATSWMRAALLANFRQNVAAAYTVLRRPPRPRFVSAIRGIDARRLWAVPAVVVATLLLGMVTIDAPVIYGTRNLPGWLVEFFRAITEFGKSGWILFPLGGVLLAMACGVSPRQPRMPRLVLLALATRLVFLFVAIGLPGLVVSVLKRVIGRGRPPLEGMVDPFLFGAWSWSPYWASLPSGHATTAFAAAFAVGMLWPRARPIMWAYALLIAASRVIVSVHYPTDVLGAAAFAFVSVLLIREFFAARGLLFSSDAQGNIQAMPGPAWRRVKNLLPAAGGLR